MSYLIEQVLVKEGIQYFVNLVDSLRLVGGGGLPEEEREQEVNRIKM